MNIQTKIVKGIKMQMKSLGEDKHLQIKEK